MLSMFGKKCGNGVEKGVEMMFNKQESVGKSFEQKRNGTGIETIVENVEKGTDKVWAMCGNVWTRCGQGVGKVWARCGQGVGKVWTRSRCGQCGNCSFFTRHTHEIIGGGESEDLYKKLQCFPM